MKTPDQSIYDYLYRICIATGGKTYPINPPKDSPYPCIALGSIQIIPKATKSRLIGTAYAIIDVWGTQVERKNVSDIATEILEKSGSMAHTYEGLQLSLDPNNSSIEIMLDNSTSEPLWRARISLTFKFY